LRKRITGLKRMLNEAKNDPDGDQALIKVPSFHCYMHGQTRLPFSRSKLMILKRDCQHVLELLLHLVSVFLKARSHQPRSRYCGIRFATTSGPAPLRDWTVSATISKDEHTSKSPVFCGRSIFARTERSAGLCAKCLATLLTRPMLRKASQCSSVVQDDSILIHLNLFWKTGLMQHSRLKTMAPCGIC